MPVISIESNKLTREKKRTLVKEITKISSEIMELPESAIIVLIKEANPEDVGVGGQLLCDRE